MIPVWHSCVSGVRCSLVQTRRESRHYFLTINEDVCVSMIAIRKCSSEERMFFDHNQTTSNNTDDDTTSPNIQKQILYRSLLFAAKTYFFSFTHKIINKFSFSSCKYWMKIRYIQTLLTSALASNKSTTYRTISNSATMGKLQIQVQYCGG